MIKILPSILSSDYIDINKDIDKFIELGLDEIHIDVMDGNFVHDLTFGPKYIACIREHYENVMLDCHLMINNPLEHVEDYIKAKVNKITVHVEACKIKDLIEISNIVKGAGIKFGIAINPSTNIKLLEKALKKVKPDLILIMSVQAGKGGQKFISDVLNRATRLLEIKENGTYSFDLEIDGGINNENIKEVIEHKIERIVMGSYLYRGMELENNINEIKEKIKVIAGM